MLFVGLGGLLVFGLPGGGKGCCGLFVGIGVVIVVILVLFVYFLFVGGLSIVSMLKDVVKMYLEVGKKFDIKQVKKVMCCVD